MFGHITVISSRQSNVSASFHQHSLFNVHDRLETFGYALATLKLTS